MPVQRSHIKPKTVVTVEPVHRVGTLCSVNERAVVSEPIMAITSAINGTLDAIRAYTGSVTWRPLVNLSRSAVLSLLRRVQVGQIVVVDVNGTVTICGSRQPKDGTPSTELRILKEAFWVRLLLFADMVRDR